jgi:outer membrane protein TolC
VIPFTPRARVLAVLLCVNVGPASWAQSASSAGGQQPALEAPAAASQQPAPTIAQQNQAMSAATPASTVAPFHVELPHQRNPIYAYRASTVPPANLQNSPRFQSLIRDGKLYISLHDAIALALENNLDLAYFRYNLPIADTDLARTKAGGQSNGVNTGIQGTQGGFSSSGGTGSGSGTGSGTGTGAGAGGAGGLVTSTLGGGTAIIPFDPQFYLQGFVDHTTTPVTNPVVYGVPLLRTNTIEGITQFSEAFPLGTNFTMTYEGQRQAANSPFNIINPGLFSTFNFTVNQPLLAGFGLATNERYIHIAQKNRQVTELAFRQQVISTITLVEDIYWDLVNAYDDEQVKERSLGFAQKTLDDDRKQLELQAIPALQVMTDESDVATREGDLTVAKATLKLNELLIKNALTKTIEDSTLEDIPVVPLDQHGTLDDNETKPIEQLIAEAEKNRPDVSQDEISMQIAQNNLKAIKNELLPSLSVYGEYAGYGSGGVLNPYCQLGTECTSTLPSGFGGTLQNTFNYSAPEYQVGFKLLLTIRNRIAKADQFRAVLEYRQKELTFEGQKKSIRFDVRNSQYALEQAKARVVAAQKTSDLLQKTFDITKEEQKLGAKSSYDALLADRNLAVAQSALVTAQAAFEKAKVDIDRATGETLDRMGVSVDDAKSGVVSHLLP